MKEMCIHASVLVYRLGRFWGMVPGLGPNADVGRWTNAGTTSIDCILGKVLIALDGGTAKCSTYCQALLPRHTLLTYVIVCCLVIIWTCPYRSLDLYTDSWIDREAAYRA